MGYVKTIDLDGLKKLYNLTVAVETGSGGGGGTNTLYKKIGKVYSCEIDSEQYEKDRKRFEHLEDVKIYNLNSVDFLNKILPVVEDKNIVFWLDSHFPNKFNNIDEILPLYNELSVIQKFRKNKRDVILMDDFKIFLMEDIYRGKNAKEYIKHIYNDNNIEIYVPSKEDIISMFPNHKHEIIEIDEYILKLTPKE
jgi:hypothetical protein